MFEIDGNYYEIVDEYLDINELRSEMDDSYEVLEGEVKIVETPSLPATGEENTIYLTPTNVISDNNDDLVEIPNPTSAGQVLLSDSSNKFKLESMQGILEADKDIISKITMEYNEDGDYTMIRFPYGVLPLKITLNTQGLYFLNGQLVDNAKETVEGYTLDDYYTDADEEGRVIVEVDIAEDISEQIINGLVYINVTGDNPTLFYNTYNLFFPPTEIKLYKHSFSIDGEGFYVISYSSTPITDAASLTQLLETSLVFRHYDASENIISYRHDIENFYFLTNYIDVQGGVGQGVEEVLKCDRTAISDDTVTEL